MFECKLASMFALLLVFPGQKQFLARHYYASVHGTPISSIATAAATGGRGSALSPLYDTRNLWVCPAGIQTIAYLHGRYAECRSDPARPQTWVHQMDRHQRLTFWLSRNSCFLPARCPLWRRAGLAAGAWLLPTACPRCSEQWFSAHPSRSSVEHRYSMAQGTHEKVLRNHSGCGRAGIHTRPPVRFPATVRRGTERNQ